MTGILLRQGPNLALFSIAREGLLGAGAAATSCPATVPQSEGGRPQSAITRRRGRSGASSEATGATLPAPCDRRDVGWRGPHRAPDGPRAVWPVVRCGEHAPDGPAGPARIEATPTSPSRPCPEPSRAPAARLRGEAAQCALAAVNGARGGCVSANVTRGQSGRPTRRGRWPVPIVGAEDAPRRAEVRRGTECEISRLVNRACRSWPSTDRPHQRREVRLAVRGQARLASRFLRR
jgi:hypothetical protein